jgi:hypothetical protein
LREFHGAITFVRAKEVKLTMPPGEFARTLTSAPIWGGWYGNPLDKPRPTEEKVAVKEMLRETNKIY